MYRFVFLLFLLSCLFGCLDGEKYNYSFNASLSYHSDTLQLDTLLSGESSRTHVFVLKNKTHGILSIASIFLQKGEKSPYQVNINGVPLKGNISSSLEVKKGDSIYVFVQASPTLGDSLYQAVLDTLNIQYQQGTQQRFILYATALNIVNIEELHITKDTTIQSRLPLRIRKGIEIKEGANLVLSAGTKILFHSQAGIEVKGRLLVDGTLEKPVILQGDRLDYMFKEQPYSRIPGQWKGLHFTSTSFENKLNFTQLLSGTTAIKCDSSSLDKEKIRIENTIIHNMDSLGIVFDNVKAYVGNSQITNSREYTISLNGGFYTFIHCTIANFFPFGSVFKPSFYCTNLKYPLLQAKFDNCLFTGYAKENIEGNRSSDKDKAFNYHFSYAAIDGREGKDSLFIHCIWSNEDKENWGEKMFSSSFNVKRLSYSFIPSLQAPFVGKANYAVSLETYPFDLNGKSRLTIGRSSMGCYEPLVEEISK